MMGWWIVCILPRFVARWLIWGRGGRGVKLPSSWAPYVLGRAIGCDGKQLPPG